MAQAIGLNPAISTLPLVQEKPCYAELFERIQAIWNAVCTWICDLVNQLFSWETKKTPLEPPATGDKTPKSTSVTISPPNHNLALRNKDCFCHMMRYLEPEEVARCESVAKSWKIDRIWQAQCANHGVTAAPQGGVFKDLFIVPEMAFGPREWRKHFGKVSPMPPLSEKVRSQIAERKNTHTLTLIPKTVNGQPLSFNTFASLAEKAGMKLDIWKDVSDKYGNEAVGKPLWVWMEQKVKDGSRNKTQAQAEQDYPKQLGRALYYTISIVAHYARYKICLFPRTPEWTYTRTSDGGENQYGAWYGVVGGSAPGVLRVDDSRYAYDGHGVAGLVPAEVLALGP